MMKKTYALLVLGAIAVGSAVVANTGTASLDRPRIHNGTNFDATLTDGAPIDTITTTAVSEHASAKDSNNYLYTAVVQTDGTDTRTFLVRNTGTTQEAWDHDAKQFTTNFALADPIDAPLSTALASSNPAIAIDSNNDVYIAYLREAAAATAVKRHYLNKLDVSASEMFIWDDGASSLTNSLGAPNAEGDSLGLDTANYVGSQTPAIAIDGNDDVYVAFLQQTDAGDNQKFFLTKFDVSATDVLIWDDAAGSLTNVVGGQDDDDSIGLDNDGFLGAGAPAIAIDSNNDVYIAFNQETAADDNEKTFLAKFDMSTTDVLIWDDAATSLTNVVGAQDDDDSIGLDDDGFLAAGNPAIAIDGNDDVYIAFNQETAADDNEKTFLSKFDVSATDVLIWDDSATSLTNVVDGAPTDDDSLGIDTDGYLAAGSPAIAIDSNNDVYVAFGQETAADDNDVVFLAKFDVSATDVFIWDDSATSLTNVVAAQTWDDGIGQNSDEGSELAGSPVISLAANDDVYVAQAQDYSEGGVDHIYASYFDASANDVLIWDNGATSWTNVLTALTAEGDAIDQGDAAFVASTPDMVATGNGIYVPFIQQSSAGGTNHLYLTRIGTGTTTVVGRRSSSGTCILGNTSDWAMIAFLASLGLLVGLGFKASVNEAK